jgi:hypothetical protein
MSVNQLGLAIMSSVSFARSVAGVLGALALATPALATDHYFAQANVTDFDSPCAKGGGGQSSSPTGVFFACPGAEAGANASQGHVGLFAHDSGNDQVFAVGSYSTAVTFVPLEGQDATTIPVQLNLNMFGSMQVGGSADTGFQVIAELEGSDFFYSTSIDTSAAPTHGVLTLQLTQGSEVASQFKDSIGGVFTTGAVDVPVLTPTNVFFQLLIGGFGNPGSLNDLFLDSLDFVHGQDVFVLPPGYTAEDPDAFIIHNRYLPPSAVPEPGSWVLLLGGFAALGAVLRRGRRTIQPPAASPAA